MKNKLQDLSRHISTRQDKQWLVTLQVFQNCDPVGRHQQTQQAHHIVSEVLTECQPVSKEKKTKNKGNEE